MGSFGEPLGLTSLGPGGRVAGMGVEGRRSARKKDADAPCRPLRGKVGRRLTAVVEEDGGRGAVDGSDATVSLDELGLELVVEEGVGLEPEEASGAKGSADVGPGVAEGDESVAVSPAVEATLSTEVAEVERDAGGDKLRKFLGKKGRTGDR